MRSARQSPHPTSAAGPRRSGGGHHPALICLIAAVAVAASAALCVAAVLAHAPAAAVPFVALACVGLPVFATWELASAVEALRAERSRSGDRAVAQLRRALDKLPEIRHPLDR